MPTLTSITPALSATGSPFTGLAIFSTSPGGCGSNGSCPIVSFEDGVAIASYLHSAGTQSNVPNAPKITLPAGNNYYTLVSGDPDILLCNPSRYCSGSFPYLAAIDSDTTDFGTILSNPALAPTLAEAQSLRTQLEACQRSLSIANSTIARLSSELVSLKGASTPIAAKLQQFKPEHCVVPAISAIPKKTTAESSPTIAQLQRFIPDHCPAED